MPNEPIQDMGLTDQSTPAVTVAPNMDAELEDALNAAFNPTSKPQTTPKTDEKPKDTAQPKNDEKPVKETETKAVEVEEPDSIPDAPPGRSSQKTTEAWAGLKSVARKAKEEVAAKEAELARMKSLLAEKGSTTAKESEELKKQINDLAKYRAVVDIQADPEFIEKFDKPIEGLIEGMKNMLLGMNVSEEVVKGINFTNTELLDQILEHIKNSPEKFKASKFRTKVEEFVSLTEDRQNALGEAKNNYEKFLEEKKKTAFARSAEDEGRASRHIDGVILSVENKDKFPFLHKIEAREGMPQAEVEQINRHNSLAEIMQNQIREMVKWSEPEKRAEMATAATMLRYVSVENNVLKQKLAAVEAELAKVSKVGSDSERTKPRAARRADEGEMDVDQALASHFNR